MPVSKSNNPDGYYFDKVFRDLVSNVVGEHPKQCLPLIDAVDKRITHKKCLLRFTEEVKDGRSDNLDILRKNAHSLIKFNVKHTGVTITVNDIKYLQTEEQETDSLYLDHMFLLDFDLKFDEG